MVSRPSLSQSILGTVAKWLGAEEGVRAISPSEPARSPEAQRMFEFKVQALTLAKERAVERGIALGKVVKPTLIDYYIAAHEVGILNAAEIANRDMRWNMRSIADLSGHTIDGFAINKSDIEIPEALQNFAAIKAATLAKAEGRIASTKDMFIALQEIQQSGEKIPPSEELSAGIKSLKDFMNLDEDGEIPRPAINKFCKGIDHNLAFNGAEIKNCDFHPAGTLMRNHGHSENGVPLTEGATITNCRFVGLGDADSITLVGKELTGNTFVDITQGTIAVGEGSVVSKSNISGVQANLVLGKNAVFQSAKVDEDTRILTLVMGAGSVLSDCDLAQSTLSPNSKFEPGAIMHNVTLGNNLSGIDMKNLTLGNVTFNDPNVSTTSFAGAHFKGNVAFRNLADPGTLNLEGAIIEHPFSVNDRTFASVGAFTMAHQVSKIGTTLAGAQKSIGTPAAAPPAQAHTVAASTPSVGGIVFTGSPDTVELTTAVASLKRTVDPDQVPFGANMRRERSNNA